MNIKELMKKVESIAKEYHELRKKYKNLSWDFHYPISTGPRNIDSSLLACRTAI